MAPKVLLQPPYVGMYIHTCIFTDIHKHAPYSTHYTYHYPQERGNIKTNACTQACNFTKMIHSHIYD